MARRLLVIVDYQMPGMKGDEVAAALKARGPRQPILMMTAYNETLRLEGSFSLAVDTGGFRVSP